MKKWPVLIFLVLLGLSFSLGVVWAQPSVGEAEEAYSRAERALGEAYLKILEAEEAGADVEGLVAEFNSLLGVLKRVEAELRSGDYDDAGLLAGDVRKAAEELSESAAGLRVLGEEMGARAFRDQVLLSSLLSVVVVVGGYLFWVFFRKRYIRELLNWELEVVEFEA